MNEPKKKYYAHTLDGRSEEDWQLLIDHLKQTAELAADKGRDAGVSDLAFVAGLLHDIGKYSDTFQARLHGSKTPVDHATAGAREIMSLFPDRPMRDLAEVISYCIAGHHSGLPDYGHPGEMGESPTLLARRTRKVLKDYSAYKTEVEVDTASLRAPQLKACQFRHLDRARNTSTVHCYAGFSASFMTRMVYSALVDADWVDTERFCKQSTAPLEGYASIGQLKAVFDNYMERFAHPTTPIHAKRTAICRECVAHAADKPGLFTLTVPTGGGKTLSSMAFALAHAEANDLKRIIYVIPYTSIIEQNAAVFRTALGPLGKDNVLEHHSNFDWERMKDGTKYLEEAADDEGVQVAEKLKRATEDWGVPIVVTTNVRFFESLFSNRKSACRRIHNLAKSVIIFDEAQMLRREYFKPCLLAMSELVQNYGASVVLSTATQPSLHNFFPESTVFTELAANPRDLFAFFQRVKVTQLGTLTDAALLERLAAHDQVLCIVNTRRHAGGLFAELRSLHPEGTFHLSTWMCAAHREETLKTIKERLVAGLPCRVVSTQVMEAGIDVDFPVGYRAMAGLDSIIQAAGRVNREMRHGIVAMYVFEPESSLIKKTPVSIQQAGAVAQSTLAKYSADPTTIEAIDDYYNQLYDLHGEKAFDSDDILGYFGGVTPTLEFSFRKAADAFRMIDKKTIGVIIPFNDKAMEHMGELERAEYPVKVLRKLQPYTVNIYENEFTALLNSGALIELQEDYFALNPLQYDTYYTESGLVRPEPGQFLSVD